MASNNEQRTHGGVRRPLRMAAAALIASSLPSATTSFTIASTYPSIRAEVQRRALALAMAKNAGSNFSGSSPQQLFGGGKGGDSLGQSEFVPSEVASKIPTTDTSPQAPPAASPLRMVCNEQREFEMNLGKAVDTLRHDYPDILTVSPDFSIYHSNLEVVDPSGVTLHGLRNYKTAFRFLHAIINLFYCPEKSSITFRLIYDWARNNIRVSWNAVLIPKAIFGGIKTRLHVDGISVYEIERSSGLITRHHIDRLLMNDRPVRPTRGIFHALTYVVDSESIPVLGMDGGNFNLEFRQQNALPSGGGSLFDPESASRSASSLSAMSSASEGRDSSAENASASKHSFDQEAFEKKNAARKKFGLKPLTPEEFEEIQVQVRQLELQQRQKAAAAASAAELSREKKSKKNNFLNIFGNIFEDTCESNFDCQRPEVCCDFGFKKMCCANGMRVINGVPQRALVPVPAQSDVDMFPRGRPGSMY